jgi:hypothetical protein
LQVKVVGLILRARNSGCVGGSTSKDGFSGMLVELILTELLPDRVSPSWMAKEVTVQVAAALTVTITLMPVPGNESFQKKSKKAKKFFYRKLLPSKGFSDSK